jgi:hypothetical protein
MNKADWDKIPDSIITKELLTADEMMEKYGDILTPFQIERIKSYQGVDLLIQVTSQPPFDYIDDRDVNFPIHLLCESPIGGKNKK